MEMKSSNYNPQPRVINKETLYIHPDEKKYTAVIKNDLLPYNDENIHILDRTKS